MRDGINNISGLHALAATLVQAAAVKGNTIDMRGANAIAVFVTVEASTDALSATNKFTIGFEEAEDDGAGNPAAWTTVPDLKVIGDSNVVIDNAAKLLKLGCLSIKRYIRLAVTPAGTHTAGSNIRAFGVKSHLQAEGKGW